LGITHCARLRAAIELWVTSQGSDDGRRRGREVELRHLRYFVAVAEEGAMRRASDRLFTAQPSISRALTQLETELGVRLLRRTPCGVELTDAGGELLVHARRILAETTEARIAMRRRAAPRAGALRIGVVAGILGASELTAPIFESYRAARPDVDVELHDVSFCDQTAPLLSRALDVSVVRGPVGHRELDVVPIALEPRVLLVSNAHELAGEECVDVEDVLDQPTLPLQAPEDWGSFWQLEDLRGASCSDPEAMPADTVANIQMSVATSRTVVSVPKAFSRLAPHPLVRTVDLAGPEPSVIAIARRRDETRREVNEFLEHATVAAHAAVPTLEGWELPAA
jgi:DNA-binding transcriptional LysR family regulator